MRILIVTDWNRGHGGAEAYIGLLRDGLIEAGDQVRLMTSSAGTMGNGKADYVAYGTDRLVSQAFLQIANPSAVYRARQAVTEFHPDVVLVNMFAHHLSPAILHALNDVPVILLVSDYKCICPLGSKLRPDSTLCESRPGWECHTAGCVSLPHWIRDQARYALLRSGIARVARVVSCSDWVQRVLRSEQIESVRVYLAIPARGADYRREPASEATFLFCGRLDIEKGVDSLIRAFAEVRQEFMSARLRIAGQGPERRNLDLLAHDLGVAGSIDFLGWLNPAEIETELSHAWALTAPSLWAEPLGLVALEAIVRGVPVIATSSGGFAETVEEGISGFLIPNGDVASLAETMKMIASRRLFPDHLISSEVSDRMADRHALSRHVPLMRSIFDAAAQSGQPRANSRKRSTRMS